MGGDVFSRGEARAEQEVVVDIPSDFVKYWRRKRGMAMTLEQCWSKWQPYWPQRQNGPEQPQDQGDSYVLGRRGDQGLYTVENCRVITHRENTLERNHKRCSDKLKGRVNNPSGSQGQPRRVLTPRGEFDNCGEAARAYGIHRTSMWHRVQSERWPEFQWQTK